MADVWLRKTRRYRRRILIGLGVMLAALELFAVMASAGGVPFARSGSTAFVVWAVLFLPLFSFQLVPRYRIRDDRLTVGRQGVGCNLPEVQLTSVRYRLPWMNRVGFLELVVNTTIVIKLADSGYSRGYYRPEDLRALADSLAKSPYPQPQRDVAWLRAYADNPGRKSWPPPQRQGLV